jgi:hypothetical protein
MRAAKIGAVKRDVTRALYVAALALGRTRDPGQVVQAATVEMQRAVEAEAVALYLLDSGRQRLVLREAVGPTPGQWERVARLSLSDALPEARVLREQRVAVSRVDEHPCAMLRSILTEQGFRYVTAVPVAVPSAAPGGRLPSWDITSSRLAENTYSRECQSLDPLCVSYALVPIFPSAM